MLKGAKRGKKKRKYLIIFVNFLFDYHTGSILILLPYL